VCARGVCAKTGGAGACGSRWVVARTRARGGERGLAGDKCAARARRAGGGAAESDAQVSRNERGTSRRSRAGVCARRLAVQMTRSVASTWRCVAGAPRAFWCDPARAVDAACCAAPRGASGVRGAWSEMCAARPLRDERCVREVGASGGARAARAGGAEVVARARGNERRAGVALRRRAAWRAR